MSRILIAGCGFLGEAAAFLFKGQGHEVHGLTASEASAGALQSRGLDASTGDLNSPEAMQALAGEFGPFDFWIHCASSGRGGVESYRSVYLEGCRNLLAVFPGVPGLFVGSTSVYAQTDGAWVDETSPALPDRETGQILRQAEEEVLVSGGWVARLAGIYGPGRSVLLRKFLSGEARIEGEGLRWINQIHRDDAAHAVGLILTQGARGEIYNVADSHPRTQLGFYEEMARLLGRPLPPSGPPDLQRKRGWTNKRVCSDKLHHLGWQLRYPDYFSALPELLPHTEPFSK